MQPNRNQAHFQANKTALYSKMWGLGLHLTPTCGGDRPGT